MKSERKLIKDEILLAIRHVTFKVILYSGNMTLGIHLCTQFTRCHFSAPISSYPTRTLPAGGTYSLRYQDTAVESHLPRLGTNHGMSPSARAPDQRGTGCLATLWNNS